ncbi:MAG: hypothetical protein RLZ33_2165 [Bacteroidota bacterium]|jgi:hypothetical protein
MKTIPILVVLLISFDFFGQSTLIPDPNFEQALIDANIDTDGLNGTILNADAEQIIGDLDVSNKNINDLTGIEAFVNLSTLNCSNNNLITLDLSVNTELIAISATSNNLTDINLTNIQALNVLDIADNQLDSLDFSSHPDLWWLMCYTNNLTYLNISTNSNLEYLSCAENQLTGNLDISNLYNLQFFVCRANQLSSITLSYHGDMSTFNCQNNSITELDLSTCYPLEEVMVDSNELIALNIKNGMNNYITDFRANGNPNLYCIQVDDSINSTNNLNWIKDSQSYYSEECDWANISETESWSFNILPNPAADWIIIKVDSPQNNHVEISDIKGKILLSQIITEKETTIDLKDLSNGAYLIKIDHAVERFIKN